MITIKAPNKSLMIFLVVLMIMFLAGLVYMMMSQQGTSNEKTGKTWKRATEMAAFAPRLYFTVVSFDNKLWVIGGNNGQLMRDVWYSDDGSTWKQAIPWAAFTGRAEHSSVVFDNKIWVIGGRTNDQSGYSGSDVWYSGDGKNWTQATPFAGFLSRHSHSSVVFNNRMWVIGGYPQFPMSEAGNDVWYSDDGRNWTQATPHAEFPSRWDHATVVYKNKMWIIGGSGKNGTTNDVWYSSNGVNWTLATSNAEFGPRQGFGAVVYDDRMWVVAGGSTIPSSYPYRNDMWYSIDGVTWTRATSHAEFSPRILSQMVTFDNKMWLIGGMLPDAGRSMVDPNKDYLTDVWYLEG
jgi:hypothetical protein